PSFRNETLPVRHHGEFPFGEWRRVFLLTHIGPQHTAALDQRVGLEFDLPAIATFLGFGRHVDALARHIIFPAVIWAAQALFLVPTEPQRYPAMGAEFVDQSEPAIAVAKRQQPL